jgi:hypothetical protein
MSHHRTRRGLFFGGVILGTLVMAVVAMPSFRRYLRMKSM